MTQTTAEQTKVCTNRNVMWQCGLAKPLSAFYRRATGTYWRQCKDCVGRRRATKYATDEDHRERVKAESKTWREENPEAFRAATEKWRKENPDKVKESSRRTMRKLREDPAVRDRQRIASRAYRHSHLAQCRERDRQYARAHPAKMAAKQRRRRAGNPAVAIAMSMSNGMWRSLGDGKAGRHWEDLVPYTVAELSAHLEAQFGPGMTWENRGKWHIDHIRPVCSFKFTTPDDAGFKACWALSNLRPMWARENQRKNGKWDGQVRLAFNAVAG